MYFFKPKKLRCFLLPCKFFKWHLFLYGINWKLYLKKNSFFFFLNKISVRMLAFNSGRDCHHSWPWKVSVILIWMLKKLLCCERALCICLKGLTPCPPRKVTQEILGWRPSLVWPSLQSCGLCLQGTWQSYVLKRSMMLKCIYPTQGTLAQMRAPKPGTKSEPTAETLMQITEVASHSLNEEFGRLINFLLITVDRRAGEKDL